MQDSSRRFWILLLVAALAGAGYFVTDQLGPKPAPRSTTSEKRPASKAATAKAATTARPRVERRYTIETSSFRAVFTNLNTAMLRMELKGERFRNARGRQQNLVSTDKEAYLPYRMELTGIPIPADAVWEGEQLAPDAVRFTYRAPNVTVVRTLRAGKGPYQVWSTLQITNAGTRALPAKVALTTHRYVPMSAEDGGFLGRSSPELTQALCQHGDDTVRHDREKLETPHAYRKNVRFAALENVYFVSALAADGQSAHACRLTVSPRGGTREEPEGALFEARLIYPKASIEPRSTKTFRTLGYFGPKSAEPLRAAGHGLPNVVDLGVFSIIAQRLVDLLSLIHGYVGNWGLAIILLTVAVKLVLYPLTERSFRSMARMRHLKPEMDRINELYKEDREKKGAAIMELYRKHKINPLGGCLPSLIQLPVWFALYTSLSTNVELYHAPFALWWTDLSSPDPYFGLPLLLGLLMFVQQRMTPTTMDPTQAKIMLYFMPVMITAFMLFLPAGLCLYMVTNSTLGIAQQQFIQQRLERQAPPTAAASADGSPPGDDSNDNVTTSTSISRSAKVQRPRPAQRRQRRGRA